MPHRKRLEGHSLGSYTNENSRITSIVYEIFLTLDFSSLLKNYFQCLSVSWESGSEVRTVIRLEIGAL